MQKSPFLLTTFQSIHSACVHSPAACLHLHSLGPDVLCHLCSNPLWVPQPTPLRLPFNTLSPAQSERLNYRLHYATVPLKPQCCPPAHGYNSWWDHAPCSVSTHLKAALLLVILCWHPGFLPSRETSACCSPLLAPFPSLCLSSDSPPIAVFSKFMHPSLRCHPHPLLTSLSRALTFFSPQSSCHSAIPLSPTGQDPLHARPQQDLSLGPSPAETTWHLGGEAPHSTSPHPTLLLCSPPGP